MRFTFLDFDGLWFCCLIIGWVGSIRRLIQPLHNNSSSCSPVCQENTLVSDIRQSTKATESTKSRQRLECASLLALFIGIYNSFTLGRRRSEMASTFALAID